MILTWQQSIGINNEHLVEVSDSVGKSFLINETVKEPLCNLLEQAKCDDIPIAIISSHRTFQQQLTIWNDKWQGYRPVYSRHGRPLNVNSMSNMEKYKAIALWSALPGLSRHHWGTDLDVFSAAAIKNGYKVELTPDEFSKNGICSEINHWLNDNLEKHGFFKPYNHYQQGVSEEPWHISHKVTSQQITTEFSFNDCIVHLKKSDIKANDFIIDMFEHYKTQYFLNICKSPVSRA